MLTSFPENSQPSTWVNLQKKKVPEQRILCCFTQLFPRRNKSWSEDLSAYLPIQLERLTFTLGNRCCYEMIKYLSLPTVSWKRQHSSGQSLLAFKTPVRRGTACPMGPKCLAFSWSWAVHSADRPSRQDMYGEKTVWAVFLEGWEDGSPWRKKLTFVAWFSAPGLKSLHRGLKSIQNLFDVVSKGLPTGVSHHVASRSSWVQGRPVFRSGRLRGYPESIPNGNLTAQALKMTKRKLTTCTRCRFCVVVFSTWTYLPCCSLRIRKVVEVQKRNRKYTKIRFFFKKKGSTAKCTSHHSAYISVLFYLSKSSLCLFHTWPFVSSWFSRTRVCLLDAKHFKNNCPV